MCACIRSGWAIAPTTRKAATYTAQDLMIVERDVGRLAKYAFDMGGTGDLLALSLSVPPWEELHELSPAELRLTNLITTDRVADVLPRADVSVPVAMAPKTVQDRFVSSTAETDAATTAQPAKVDQDRRGFGPDRERRGACASEMTSL